MREDEIEEELRRLEVRQRILQLEYERKKVFEEARVVDTNFRNWAKTWIV